jgi:hypothetical protein
MTISLRQLEYFVTVVDEGSFTRAADVLHVSQPGLSHQILALERQLGGPLLERLPRKVRLTPAGRTVIPHAVSGPAAGAIKIGRVACDRADLLEREWPLEHIRGCGGVAEVILFPDQPTFVIERPHHHVATFGEVEPGRVGVQACLGEHRPAQSDLEIPLGDHDAVVDHDAVESTTGSRGG